MFTSPSSPLLSLLFLPLLSLSAAPTAAKLLCHRGDAETLIDIKRSFDRPPQLSSWTASTNCCREWAGIWCGADAGGRVTALILQYTGLSGPIPPAIARISHLRDLIIVANPNLTDAIPPSIAELHHLSHLRITENPSLAGHIPESLCRLPKLEGIFLYINNLTGPIPGCFGNISDVDFSNNRLSGPIPASFMCGSTASSVKINLRGNRLSGPIPTSLGAAAIVNIDVSENRFTDTLALFGEEKASRVMQMSHNRLEFDISRLSFPLGLLYLSMDHNRLRGSIPPQVAKLESMSSFDVSYNELCGPIPSGRNLGLLNPSLFEHNRCLCDVPLQPCRR